MAERARQREPTVVKPMYKGALRAAIGTASSTGDSSEARLRLLVLAYLLMYPVPWFFWPPPHLLAAAAASLLGLGVFLPLYFHSFGSRRVSRLWTAVAMLAIGFALAPFRGIWTVFVVYAAAGAGCVRPARLGIGGVLAVLAATAFFALVTHVHPMDWVGGVFFGTIVGLSAVFNAAMNERDEQLAKAREDARQFAVIAERERIARDLHDVLGHTLTLVAVKADLALKLLQSDPVGARREIVEIHAAARASLGEVRAAVTGMRSATLATELAEARRALEGAGIAVESATSSEPLPPPVETALAYVIREAATNILRHSGASRCRIVLTRDATEAELAIQDDGRGGRPVEGHGLAGMRQRLAAIRGALDVRGDGGMLIKARVPLAETPT